jgi:hypothetical protein
MHDRLCLALVGFCLAMAYSGQEPTSTNETSSMGVPPKETIGAGQNEEGAFIGDGRYPGDGGAALEVFLLISCILVVFLLLIDAGGTVHTMRRQDARCCTSDGRGASCGIVQADMSLAGHEVTKQCSCLRQTSSSSCLSLLSLSHVLSPRLEAIR